MCFIVPSEYSFEDHEVTPDTLSDFVARKRELFALPRLDDDSSSISRSSDLDLDLTGGQRSDHLFGTWSFRHVPMTLRGSFLKNEQSFNGSSDSSSEISLRCGFPRRNPTLGDRLQFCIRLANLFYLGDVCGLKF